MLHNIHQKSTKGTWRSPFVYTVEYKSKGYIFEGRLEAMEFIARILKEAENKLVENTMIVKEIIALEITKVIRSECNHAVNRQGSLFVHKLQTDFRQLRGVSIQINKQIEQFQHEDIDEKLQIVQNEFSQYHSDTLREQILLFDKDQQITNFLKTEVALADNPVCALQDLAYNLIKLYANETQCRSQIHVLAFNGQKGYTKEQLDRIEQQCMQTFAKVKQQRKRIDRCCVCLVNSSDVVMMPCLHLVLCQLCSQSIEKCPICKRPVEHKLKVFH